MIVFIGKQEYPTKDNVIYEDKQSKIFMLKYGKNACTGNSRNVHVHYFFVKDPVGKGEIRVEYCPSELMLADFFTKPLQGQLFKKCRDVLMGYTPLSSLKQKYCNSRSVLEIVI